MFRIDTKKLLFYLIIIDLVLSGVGRIIVFGPLTSRTILFVIATFSWLLPSLMRGYYKSNIGSVVTVLGFLSYLMINILLIGDSSFSTRVDFFLRYAFLLMVFYFENYFKKDSIYEGITETKELLKLLTLIFSIFSIGLWIWVWFKGEAAYQIIEINFFKKYSYGQLAFIHGKIPRIFMKTSVFIPIGLFFQVDDFMRFGTKKTLLCIVIHALAIITTFTTGFWIFSVVIVFVILLKNGVNPKVIYAGVIGLFCLMLLNNKFDLLNILESKYEGNYTADNRLVQFKGLFKEFMVKPVFGHGFGHKVAIEYNGSIRVTESFEISYCELLVDTGVVGLLLFLFCIFYYVIRLIKQSRIVSDLFIFSMGLIFICLQSTTNPYINNSIGLTYFGICAGLSNCLKHNTNNNSSIRDYMTIKHLLSKYEKKFNISVRW